MTRQKKYMLGGATLALSLMAVFVLFIGAGLKGDGPAHAVLFGALQIETQAGDVQHFDVEVVDTPELRALGLMHRRHMPEHHGMLFTFETQQNVSFWMKNTLIPLDLLYLKRDGVIHHIHHRAKPLDLTPLPSKGPVIAVLEINGGLARRLNIRVGDIVKHDFFANKLDNE